MKNFLHLLRSMRFAIAILTVVAIASAIGSVLEQNQPYVTYVSRYGEFWAELFLMAGLTDIYHAGWFLLLLAFMATSTALCLAQNTPGMLREMRGYRENRSLQSLRKLPHQSEIALAPAADVRGRLEVFLQANRFRFKAVELDAGGYLLAARTGGTRRLGYLLVHGAMVLICIGGLIDGNIGLRLQMLTGQLQTETRDLPPARVPARSRLAPDAGSFRATMSLAEGAIQNSAYLSFNDGYLLQELPFAIKLNRFRIEHYANGQPKDFASEIEILDGDRAIPVTLQVNHPFTYRGVTLYQSGFADGGTALDVDLLRLDDSAAPARIDGTVGRTHPLLIGGEPFTIEFTDFRPTNVFENEAVANTARSRWFTQAGVGGRMRDVGASMSFKLRNQAGQADDWNVYMKPIEIDHARYFVIGRRGAQEDALRYVRLPLDSGDSLASYRRLSAAFKSEQARTRAAQAISAGVRDPKLASALEKSVLALLDAFAAHGLRGISTLVQDSVPQAEQATAAGLYLDLLERAAAVLYGGTPPTRFIRDSLQAYDDSIEAGVPMFFHLTGFNQVNASGLQLTRAPGAAVVYLGAALLALGVCAMYFVRERRLWLRVTPTTATLLLAYTANRQSPALQAEFDAIRTAISDLTDSKR